MGRTAAEIAARTGIDAPPGTRVLIAPLDGVGREHPLSIEKLCPVLSFYVVADWREGCERCMQILRYGGMGHTMAIHSQDEQVILEFGLRKPAFRIVVNTPTTLGSIGMTTGLDPSMTLGCGGHGGNITSDNITPRHLLNVKRLAWEVRPADRRAPDAPAARAPAPPNRAAARPRAGRLDPGLLARRIDAFLAQRGVSAPPASTGAARAPAPPAPPAGSARAASPANPAPAGAPGPLAAAPAPVETGSPSEPGRPVEFVCEDDVRRAVEAGRCIAVDERTIVTPAARDLAEQHRTFVQA